MQKVVGSNPISRLSGSPLVERASDFSGSVRGVRTGPIWKRSSVGLSASESAQRGGRRPLAMLTLLPRSCLPMRGLLRCHAVPLRISGDSTPTAPAVATAKAGSTPATTQGLPGASDILGEGAVFPVTPHRPPGIARRAWRMCPLMPTPLSGEPPKSEPATDNSSLARSSRNPFPNPARHRGRPTPAAERQRRQAAPLHSSDAVTRVPRPGTTEATSVATR